ncbi:alpha-protein kinase vwkA [Biomphalaria pfeifferi]|uniref:Alpha-protein kinase vwkA n=1 Tax=Biomphalaria pfeifferi TaxID=112525 RepID=A0AAD8BXR2_BIOPF|nr:alpha-protein kinase vwkA [Biomphalaria pfeifferi]
MEIKVDNTTELARDQGNGNSYEANFEFFPFHEGETYSLYKGVLNGECFASDRHGERCVVRTLKKKSSNSYADWDTFVQIASNADELASQFHRETASMTLSFPRPLLTNVNQKSSFVGVFRTFNPHEKRLKINERVVIEPFVGRPFFQFHKQNEANNQQSKSHAEHCAVKGNKHKSTKKNSNCVSREQNIEEQSYPVEVLPTLAAFSHYTWHATKKFIVTNFQGSFNHVTSSLTLINPTIHSIDQRYGETDKGLAGIEDFFNNHECYTDLCSTWCKYETPDPNGNFSEQVSSLNQPD